MGSGTEAPSHPPAGMSIAADFAPLSALDDDDSEAEDPDPAAAADPEADEEY